MFWSNYYYGGFTDNTKLQIKEMVYTTASLLFDSYPVVFPGTAALST